MLTLNFPINSTSLGAAGFHFLENIEEDFNLFPIGNSIDTAAFEPLSMALKMKVQKSLDNALGSHSIETPSLKLWHGFQGLERVSKRQALYTFHELDSLTQIEKNNLIQQEALAVPCSFNKEVFEANGVKVPISVIPLGVDRQIFYPLEKYKNKSGPYIFLMAGKFEARKLHVEILQAFAMTFANNPSVKLRCCITNRFVEMKAVYEMIHQQIFGGRMPNNIEFVEWLPTERHFADFLSSGDCLITPSRGESFNLPLLQAMSCGVQVITNPDHAHRDYITIDNSILCKSEGKAVAMDNMFFRNDGKTNTGSWFMVSVNSIAQAMIEAYKKGRVFNSAGIETASKMSWKASADKLIKLWGSLKT